MAQVEYQTFLLDKMVQCVQTWYFKPTNQKLQNEYLKAIPIKLHYATHEFKTYYFYLSYEVVLELTEGHACGYLFCSSWWAGLKYQVVHDTLYHFAPQDRLVFRMWWDIHGVTTGRKKNVCYLSDSITGAISNHYCTGQLLPHSLLSPLIYHLSRALITT